MDPNGIDYSLFNRNRILRTPYTGKLALTAEESIQSSSKTASRKIPSVEDGEFPNGTGPVWHTRWSRIQTNAMIPSEKLHANEYCLVSGKRIVPEISMLPVSEESGSTRFVSDETVSDFVGLPWRAELLYLCMNRPSPPIATAINETTNISNRSRPGQNNFAWVNGAPHSCWGKLVR